MVALQPRADAVALAAVLQRHADAALRQRYAGWERDLGQRILKGQASLADLSKLVLDQGLEPKPKSGRQELLENLVSRYL